MPGEWRSAIDGNLHLTRETRGGLVLRKGKHFDSFPHYRTFGEALRRGQLRVVDLSPYQVNALANLTAWTVCREAPYLARHLGTGAEAPHLPSTTCTEGR